jgi:GntR family transcriptional regulator, transcriptional repressor for pyruvate dehydrogenase complex
MNTLSPFRAVGHSENLVNRVAKQVEQLILDEKLPIGSKLPPEREFAVTMGVSRTVIREAVRILVARGLLDTRPGMGNVVRRVTTEDAARPLTLLFQTRGGELPFDQLHQVRRILEVETAGIAAEMASDENIKELWETCFALRDEKINLKTFVEKDAEFHKRIAEATKNPFLVILLDSIRSVTDEVRTLVAAQPGSVLSAMAGHLRILDSIEARNAEGARQAMNDHLEAARRSQEEAIRIVRESEKTPAIFPDQTT